MPRTRKDGNPLPTKVVVPFTAKWIAGLKPGPERRTFYDSKLAGFALRLEPSGHRSFKLVYRHRKRPRWFDLGSVDRYPGEAGLSVARAKVMQLLLQMAGDDTFDPQGYRAEERSSGTFADDLKAHLADCAKRLKSSEQKGKLLTSVFLDAWANQPTSTITRGDVQHVLEKCKRKATSKKQAKVHLSAFFSWARKKRIYTADNPTSDIDVEDAKIKKGARVLSVDEMPAFWKALKSIDRNDALALKLILLLGARGGEVIRLRYEHIKRETLKLSKKQRARLKAEGHVAPETVSGFCWVQPGAPDAEWKRAKTNGVPERKRPGWDGTKNSIDHRYWLPQVVVDMLGGDPGDRTGPVFPRWRDLSKEMLKVCAAMGLAKDDGVTPHDLRRSFSDTVGWCGYPDEAMHRIINHKPSGLTQTYSPSQKLEEAWEISNAVCAELLERATQSAKTEKESA